MYEIYEKLLLLNKIDSAEVSRRTGIRQSTLSNWKNRRNLLGSENAIILARFFGVSLDYLMTGKEAELSPMPNLGENEMLLLQGFHAMGAEAQSYLLMMARDALGRKKGSSATSTTSHDKVAV